MNSSKNNKHGGYWNQTTPCTEEEVGRLMLENIKLLLQKKDSDVELKNNTELGDFKQQQQQLQQQAAPSPQQHASAPSESSSSSSQASPPQASSAPSESPPASSSSSESPPPLPRQVSTQSMLQSDKNLYIATLKSVLESTQSPSSQPLQQQNQKIEIVINLLSKLPSGEYEQVITGINDLRKTFLQKGEE